MIQKIAPVKKKQKKTKETKNTKTFVLKCTSDDCDIIYLK